MWSVLRAPGVLRLFGASCVARLPMGALGLLLVLQTQATTGSYGRGGLAAGTYALALGLSNPVLARAVDRRGQTVVLRAGALVSATAIAALAVLPASAPFAATLLAAAVGGAAQPPIGACMRALWPSLIDDPGRRHAAYSLESVALELVYICGPVVIVAGIGSWSVRAAILACAAFLLAGDLAFAAQRPSRAWRPQGARAAGAAGALAAPGVRVLVVVFALAGLAVGAVEVVVPAILTPLGHRDLTGVMLALWRTGVDGGRRGQRARGRGGAARAAAGAAHRRVGRDPRRRRAGPLAARRRAAAAPRGNDDRADVRVRERDARPPRAGRDAHRGLHLALDRARGRGRRRQRRRRGARRRGLAPAWRSRSAGPAACSARCS